MNIGVAIALIALGVGLMLGFGSIIWGLLSADWRLVMRGAGVLVVTISAIIIGGFLLAFIP